jgi:hypothetical protein
MQTMPLEFFFEGRATIAQEEQLLESNYSYIIVSIEGQNKQVVQLDIYI